MTPTRRTAWWGEMRLGLDECDCWQIGPLLLWVQRASAEWKVAYAWREVEGASSWKRERRVEFPEEGASSERFAVQKTGGIVRLGVVTPNRSVVARPRSPLRVPSGHEARIYVSTPLWVEVSVGSAATHLLELAASRLSDTWFGPSTREGQFAFALKTNARTRVDELPLRPYRFVTPVVIRNEAKGLLQVERLSLPVPNLSVYGSVDSLWSEEVRMLRTDEGDLAELEVGSGAPAEASSTERLCEPREQAAKGHLFRAFSSWLEL